MSDCHYCVHKSSYVDGDVSIGEGTSIWHFCHIMEGARIGKGCKIGQNVVVHPSVVIGNNVKVQNNVSLYDGVVLEDDVFCGPSCVFTNIINPRSGIPRNSSKFYKKTFVKKGASIGANVTIVCGVTIGRYAFVGAGSVVTKDIPNFALVYGNPSRVKGYVCICGFGIEFDKEVGQCLECKINYINENGVVKKQ